MAASETPTLISSEKTVAAAGTAEALSASSQRVQSLSVIREDGKHGPGIPRGV